MKDTNKLFLGALGLSWLLSILFFLLLAAVIEGSVTGDIRQILVVNLQLDGVLLGFSATTFAFLFNKLAGSNARMALAYATTAFMSFFFSVAFSLQALLKVVETEFFLKLLPICFTLSGVMATIAFLVDIGLKAIKQQEGKT